MLLALSPLVFTFVGCGGENHPVEGKVVFSDGQVAAVGASVIFTSEDGLNSGYGAVVEDGAFTLTFNDPGKGAPAGNYNISFRQRGTMGMTAEEIAAMPRILGKYLSPDTSGIESSRGIAA